MIHKPILYAAVYGSCAVCTFLLGIVYYLCFRDKRWRDPPRIPETARWILGSLTLLFQLFTSATACCSCENTMSPHAYNFIGKHLPVAADILSASEAIMDFVAAVICVDTIFLSHFPSLVFALPPIIGSILGLAETTAASGGLSGCAVGIGWSVCSYAFAAPVLEKAYEKILEKLSFDQRQEWEQWRESMEQKWNNFTRRGGRRVPAYLGGGGMASQKVTDEATQEWAKLRE
jgi:hypothetical protein